MQSVVNRNCLQLPGSMSSLQNPSALIPQLPSLLSPGLFPHRRKAEPLSPGIPGLPKPKKQRKMSTINEEGEKSIDYHNESTVSDSKKDKVISPQKEKSVELNDKQDGKVLEKSSSASSKHDIKCSNGNATSKKTEEPKTIKSRQINSMNVKFIITNDEGMRLESDSYKG